MRIRINDWEKFQMINHIQLRKDVIKKPELEVYATFEIHKLFSKEKHLLIYIDFYWYYQKKVIIIKEGNYYDIISDDFSNEYIRVPKFISYYYDKEEMLHLKLKMRNAIAKTWMIEDKEYFSKVFVRYIPVTKKFIEKELSNDDEW